MSCFSCLAFVPLNEKIEMNGLSEQQDRFCQEYLKDFHIGNAALRAGYSESSASAAGSRLLKSDKIQERLRYYKRERNKRTEVTLDKVVKEIAKIAFHNVQELLDFFDGKVRFKNLDEIDFPEIIKSIEVKKVKEKGGTYGEIIKIQVYDKVKALELLGKHVAAFTENVDVTSNGKELPAPQNIINIAINHRSKNEPLEK